MDEPIDMKVVVIGTTCVGKTCIVQRATTGQFNERSTSTLGASYISRVVEVNSRKVNLQIWDTAGQERYKGMTPMYYRGAHAALLVYAIDSNESFVCIDEWFESLEKNKSNDVTCYLIANKCDLDNRVVSTADGKKKAEDINATYVEVSALSGENIDDLFLSVAKRYLQDRPVDYQDKKDTVDVTAAKQDKKKCCN